MWNKTHRVLPATVYSIQDRMFVERLWIDDLISATQLKKLVKLRWVTSKINVSIKSTISCMLAPESQLPTQITSKITISFKLLEWVKPEHVSRNHNWVVLKLREDWTVSETDGKVVINNPVDRCISFCCKEIHESIDCSTVEIPLVSYNPIWWDESLTNCSLCSISLVRGIEDRERINSCR